MGVLQQYGSSDLVTHMKTTIEVSDPLLEEAKRVALRDKTTLRALIEAGLRSVLKERRQRGRFRLRDASFRGTGLSDEFRGVNWERIPLVAIRWLSPPGIDIDPLIGPECPLLPTRTSLPTAARSPLRITPRSKPPENRSARPIQAMAFASFSARSKAACSPSISAKKKALALPSSTRTTATLPFCS
jgi:hypothetical protein